MFRSHRSQTTVLRDILRGLPEAVTVFGLESAWLVVGARGIFVVTEDCGDLGAAALHAAEIAEEVRFKLSDELVWVPFIDPMCATTAVVFEPVQPCLIIPLDLVATTVSDGPGTIDDETLATLRLLGYPVLA